MSKAAIPSPEDVLRGHTTVYLATLDGDQPRVRPVTMVQHEGTLYVLTRSQSNKTAQIRRNGKVEVVAPFRHGEETGYIRFSATVTIEAQPKVRAEVAKATSFFSNFWKSPEDPGYTLVRIQPTAIECLRPGELEPVRLSKFDFRRR
jgi:general stress protein 26